MSEQLIQLILFILIYIYNVCQLNYFNKLLTTRFSSRMMITFLSLFLTLVQLEKMLKPKFMVTLVE